MLIPFVDLSSNVTQERIGQSLALKSHLKQNVDEMPVKKQLISTHPKLLKFRSCDLEFMMRIA